MIRNRYFNLPALWFLVLGLVFSITTAAAQTGEGYIELLAKNVDEPGVKIGPLFIVLGKGPSGPPEGFFSGRITEIGPNLDYLVIEFPGTGDQPMQVRLLVRTKIVIKDEQGNPLTPADLAVGEKIHGEGQPTDEPGVMKAFKIKRGVPREPIYFQGEVVSIGVDSTIEIQHLDCEGQPVSVNITYDKKTKLVDEQGQPVSFENIVPGVFIHGESVKYSKHGWNHYGPGYFTIDRDTGVLTSHNGMGLFWYSARKFGDFVLELDFMCDAKETNSGIFVRIPNMPASNDYVPECFEIQIYDAALDKKEHVMHEGAAKRDPTMLHATGAVYDAEPPKKMTSLGPDKWNHYKITCQGLRYLVELNGEVVNDWMAEPRGKVETHWPKGYIGLQNHDATSSVHFHNIRIKEL